MGTVIDFRARQSTQELVDAEMNHFIEILCDALDDTGLPGILIPYLVAMSLLHNLRDRDELPDDLVELIETLRDWRPSGATEGGP